MRPVSSFSMLAASVMTAAEEIWRMWWVRKETGRTRLYLVPSRPFLWSPARRAEYLSQRKS